MCDQRPVFLGSLVLSFLLFFVNGESCSNTSSLVGYQSEFKMLQHQLRGVFTVVDDCSFRVSRFDMLSGSDVHWWGAMTSDFQNMTNNGFVISDHTLNQTFNNASFIVPLLGNVTWDQLGLILGMFFSPIPPNQILQRTKMLLLGNPITLSPTRLLPCLIIVRSFRISIGLGGA